MSHQTSIFNYFGTPAQRSARSNPHRPAQQSGSSSPTQQSGDEQQQQKQKKRRRAKSQDKEEKEEETEDEEDATPPKDPLKQSRHGRPDLRKAHRETKEILPTILAQISHLNPGRCFHFKHPGPLGASYCPGFALPASDPKAGRKGTRIRVLDADTYDAALALQSNTTVSTVLPPPTQSSHFAASGANPVLPVAVLNLASERSPGGGWRHGSLAQEEALCYRSSLYLSLHRRYYPLPSLSALYSPYVLIIRASLSIGHALLFPTTQAVDLPMVSVITLAALRNPAAQGGKFTKMADRDETKEKIRVVLRTAARREHRRIVLGALGCGAFGNPPEDVAECFKEVFAEREFCGGWWEDVVFAVMDNAKGPSGKNGDGNFGIFYRALDGVVV
ncbi:hypothetical protein BS50DRAFT_577379 [Corynespora cassiicola Philippines]|uniref:Microbial-type PARG catalytic domain-containing protein n=1 Tax=Corynespora cassiicola Philippines TaxID=1448308 RepID=A0A2T2NAM7_CORCC|nr:hypothetical protein BS50DRAFT_577379 [Corynespora cassiicola Philippines]